MPLEPKFVDVPMKFGIDEDVDPASDPQGLLVLENAEYTKDGAIRGRNGFRRDVLLPSGAKVRGLIQASGSLGIVTTDKVMAVSPGSGSTSLADPSSIGETKTLFLGSTGQNVVSVDSHRKIVNGVDYTFVAMTVLDQTDPAATIDIPPNAGVAPGSKPTDLTTIVVFQLRESLSGTVVREGKLSSAPSEYFARVVNWTTGWVVLTVDQNEEGSGNAKLKSYHVPGVTGNITAEVVAPALNLNWEDLQLHLPGCPFDAVFDQNPITQSGPAIDKIYIAISYGLLSDPVSIIRYVPGVSYTVISTGRVPNHKHVCTVTLCVAEYDDGPMVVVACYDGDYSVSITAYSVYLNTKSTNDVPDLISDDQTVALQAPIVATIQQFERNKDVVLLYGMSFGPEGSTNSAHGTRVVRADGQNGATHDAKFWPGIFPSTKVSVRPGFVDGITPGLFVGIRDFYADASGYRSSQLARVTSGNGNLLDRPRPQGMLLHQEESWPHVGFLNEDQIAGPDTFFQWVEDPQTNDLPGEMILPSLVPFGDGFTVSMPARLQSTQDGNKIVKRYRTVEAVMDPAVRKPVVYAQLAGSATLAGSMPVTWDGTNVSTAAWLRAPAVPVLGSVPAGTVIINGETLPLPGLPAGTYNYVQILEHTDHNGTIVRSPPSPTASITLPEGTGFGSTRYPTFLPTMPDPVLTPISVNTGYRLKLYRTQAGGADYRLVLNMAIYPGQEYEPWVDKVKTEDWATGETPYSLLPNIGEASADPVPSFSHVATHRNRMFGVRSDSRAIRYTKEIPDDSGRPEWPDEFEIRVDNDAGPVSAVASLSDLLVVFHEHAVCIIDGPGPDNTGQPLNSFTVPQKVVTGYGVAPADSASVVTTPIGVLFRHITGIKLMTRPTEIADIGDAVRDQVIQMGNVSGVYMQSRRQVWFYGTADSRILILDVDRLRWMVWTPNLAGGILRGATELAGVQYVVTDLALWFLDETVWGDTWQGTGRAYTEVLDIPWFRGAGQAGMQRVWDVAISGVCHAQTMSVFKVEVFTQQAHRPSKQPEIPDAAYSFINHIPPGDRQFILTFRPRVQRCIALRLRITMTSTNGATPRPPDISNIRYHFGVVTPQGRAPTFPTIT